MNVVASYGEFVYIVRVALLYLGIAFAVVCAIDWAVRTRRISPFNRIARFFRSHVDPMFAPIERVIVRAGGVPTAAAWWGFVAFIVAAILLISFLRFVGDVILYQAVVMVQHPNEAWRILASWAFMVLQLALLVRVLSSWFAISPYSRWIRWSFVLTNWIVLPLQRVIPRIGMIDISPLVAWLLLRLAAAVLLS